ncbi:MAG: DUF87 domain-containing protein [Bauldia sp.]|nr:DUF87 domain-containing protein [Bauldia sp.]
MKVRPVDSPAPSQFAAADPAPRGRIVSVSGSSAVMSLADDRATVAGEAPLTVGKLVAIATSSSIVVGAITAVSDGSRGHAGADIDLLGEIALADTGKHFFQRGISGYPVIGDAVALMTTDQLRLIYDLSGQHTIEIGRLSQDGAIPAYIDVDEMVNKHFAILGTTGVGKSSGVAVILREILRARPQQRVFLVDPHNEYGQCFGPAAQVLSPTTLRLPFWLFNFEEIVDAIFRARPGVDEEVGILSEAIPEAKNRFASERDGQKVSLRKAAAGERGGYTVDTPVPYRLSDLIDVIDDRMGKLENRSAFPKYNRLISRIETLSNDPRYGFMFQSANVGGDTMVDVLTRVFQLTEDGTNVSVLQLAGFPAEVVDSLVSVLCRMAFEFGLWSGGAVPLLVVCEESHRYAPADKSIGFGPTKKALSRIAKEGRKYAVHLGLITQRPAELDATILSQCSTLFTMRMANDRDQDIVRSAVSDAAASLLAFVPSLGTGEVFAFGEGVSLPTRLRFHRLPKHLLPQSTTAGEGVGEASSVTRPMVAAVVERWRNASMSRGVPPPIDGLPGLLQDQAERALAPSAPPRETATPDRSAPTPRSVEGTGRPLGFNRAAFGRSDDA